MRRALLVAAPALALTARNLLAPVEQIVGRVPDDALFYLVIARRLHAGEGFTFDGVAPTTGFHPAWLAVVAAVVPTADPATGFRALLALHGAITVVSVLLLDRLLARAGVGPWRRGLGAAAAGAWAASAYGLGMETGLVGALGLVGVGVGFVGAPLIRPSATFSASETGRRTRVGVPFLLGLAMALTRVDALPLLLGAGRRAPVALVGGAFGVLVTAGFNRAVAGEWASTSASLKALGSVAERLARLDPAGVWRHVPGPAVAAIVVIGVAWASGVRRLPAPLVLAIAGGAAWIGASYVFNNLVGPWYFLPLTWILVATAIVASARASAGVGAVLMVGMIVALVRGVGLPAPGLHATVVAFAHDVAASTTPGARLVAEDFPGILAWFGERTVFPADGLAAAPGYRSALTTGTAFAWWAERGATHYVVTRRRAPWPGEGPSVDHVAPAFLPVPASPVALDPNRRVVERVDGVSRRLFALYAVDPGALRGAEPPVP